MISVVETHPKSDPIVAAQEPQSRIEVAADLATPVNPVTDTPGAQNPALLERLLAAEEAQYFRFAWDQIQFGFVDDPLRAVHKADGLVAEVMKALADSVSSERGALKSQAGSADDADTECLRIVMRRYHFIVQRLLAL